MFCHADIKGFDLADGTLCLTYDDGPGPRTAELAEYLAGEAIAATFFVIGRHAEDFRLTLDAMAACGHAIGNHTFNHPGLVKLVESGGDVVPEIARTDEIIRPYADGEPIFFPAPYGNWRQVDPATGRDRTFSIVAEALNETGSFHDYIGPVNWDISAEDFAFWRRGASAAEAAKAYLSLIEKTGRGIVLLHDSSDEEAIRRNNRTLALTKQLVPAIKRRGFQFVPLGELPAGQEDAR